MPSIEIMQTDVVYYQFIITTKTGQASIGGNYLKLEVTNLQLVYI
jgi:hypothetical protein